MVSGWFVSGWQCFFSWRPQDVPQLLLPILLLLLLLLLALVSSEDPPQLVLLPTTLKMCLPCPTLLNTSTDLTRRPESSCPGPRQPALSAPPRPACTCWPSQVRHRPGRQSLDSNLFFRHPMSLSVSSRRVAPRHCSSSSSSRQLRVAAAVRQSRPPLLALLGLRRCLRPHDCEGSAAAYLSRGKQTTSRPTSAGTGWARRRGTRISTGRSRQPDQLCHVQRQQVRHRPEVQYPSVEVSTASTSSREARAII